MVCWTTQKKKQFINSLWVWSSRGINRAKIQTAGYTSSFSSCCVRLDPELNQNSFSQNLVRTEPQSHRPDSLLLWSTANCWTISSVSWFSFCCAFQLCLVSKHFKHTSCGMIYTTEEQIYCLYSCIHIFYRSQLSPLTQNCHLEL